MKKNLSRPLLIFYLLVLYIFIQFCWWAYHIYSLQFAIYNLQLQRGIDTNLNAKVWMIIGEGSVFLVLLIIGAIITRDSFKKEVALGKQQSNFLLSVTHELKSPIAAVKLYLETLLKRDFEKEKQKEILSNSLNETERLLSLVENILFSAKIESGNFSLHKERINISEYTKEIISILFARDSGQKNHRISPRIGPDIFLDTDKHSYFSIILNLVENAMKYSSAGSKISVELKKENNLAVFSVIDEGIGIPENEKENIFKKFYRLGNEETRKTRGTGLGLYIVNYLVEQLGGTISVRNNIPRGSVFEVRFKM